MRAAVERVLNDLPDGADTPRVEKNDDEGDPVIRLALSSPSMTPLELSDYASRFITDRLARLPGVANAQIFGERAPSMRIWLDQSRMAAYGITTSDIIGALQANNVELPAGQIETNARQLQVLAQTRFTSADVCSARSCCATRAGALCVLATSRGSRRGPRTPRPSIAPTAPWPWAWASSRAGAVEHRRISTAVRAELDRIRDTLPDGMALTITTDEAVFIESSIETGPQGVPGGVWPWSRR